MNNAIPTDDSSICLDQPHTDKPKDTFSFKSTGSKRLRDEEDEEELSMSEDGPQPDKLIIQSLYLTIEHIAIEVIQDWVERKGNGLVLQFLAKANKKEESGVFDLKPVLKRTQGKVIR